MPSGLREFINSGFCGARAAKTAGGGVPAMEELLASVSDFLRDEVMANTQGRLQFLARVAANSLNIVQREQALAAQAWLMKSDG